MQILQKALDWFKSLFWKVPLTGIILIKISNKSISIVLNKSFEDRTEIILWQEEMELTLVGLQVNVMMMIMMMVVRIMMMVVTNLSRLKWCCR